MQAAAFLRAYLVVIAAVRSLAVALGFFFVDKLTWPLFCNAAEQGREGLLRARGDV